MWGGSNVRLPNGALLVITKHESVLIEIQHERDNEGRVGCRRFLYLTQVWDFEDHVTHCLRLVLQNFTGSRFCDNFLYI